LRSRMRLGRQSGIGTVWGSRAAAAEARFAE
jgi:hypothetical protein